MGRWIQFGGGGGGRVYVPSIGMINLTMVVNSTNITIIWFPLQGELAPLTKNVVFS